jgi:hypothetical protein
MDNSAGSVVCADMLAQGNCTGGPGTAHGCASVQPHIVQSHGLALFDLGDGSGAFSTRAVVEKGLNSIYEYGSSKHSV